MSGAIRILAAVTTALLAIAVPSAAQLRNSGSIAGTVTDESGAVLPGVTITATSPALQVKQLDTVTDASGHYLFPDLPGSPSRR